MPGQFKLFLTLTAGGEFKLSLYLAIIPALVIYSLSNSLFAAFQFWLVGIFLIYSQIRERVKVRDVLIGRSFSCKSVVNLIAMEEEIAHVADGFRHVLEAMKNWGGREIIELAPYQAPILRVIEKSHESA